MTLTTKLRRMYRLMKAERAVERIMARKELKRLFRESLSA